MGLFTRELGKPGKGIDANAPEKRSFFRFFDIFFRKFWHFVRLNILYVVMCIPTFIIIFVLSSLISNSFFDASGVIDTLNSVGESMAAASESGTTAEMYTSRLVVFFDVLIRFGFSFLLWHFGEWVRYPQVLRMCSEIGRERNTPGYGRILKTRRSRILSRPPPFL